MCININKVDKIDNNANMLLLINNLTQLNESYLSKDEITFIKNDKKENTFHTFNKLNFQIFVAIVKLKNEDHITKENFRKAGASAINTINSFDIETLTIIDYTECNYSSYFAEGIVLASYKFDKYKTTDKKTDNINTLNIYNKNITINELEILNISNQATYWCRNLLNEPQSILNSETITKEFVKMGKETGINVEILNKSKIESLKMGGLLAVNQGSLTPPTFTIMEWKPKNAINTKPYIFVGKGVVYDTGGLNIKTGDSMTNMHMDMGGAAAASTAIYAIAKAKLSIYTIAIIPATDNRPGQNAYVPGDIITMHNNKTVEVLNTDAEGRLILADALSYAQKYDPEIVIDLATLTGAAARAIGKYGIVAMKNNEADITNLNQSSLNVYERLVEFPMWEEYDELIKTDVADIKNIGGVDAGAITAGKFLQHFVNYPWIHLDIAGPAMLNTTDSYRTKGGSGVGTRLLFNFIAEIANN